MNNEALQQCIFCHNPTFFSSTKHKYFTWKSWNNVVHFYSLNLQVFLCLFLTYDFFFLKFNVNDFRLLYGFFNFLIWRFFSLLWFHEFSPVIRIFQFFDLTIFLTALISRIFLFFQNWAELQTGTEFLFFPTSRKRFKNRMKKNRASLIRKY